MFAPVKADDAIDVHLGEVGYEEAEALICNESGNCFSAVEVGVGVVPEAVVANGPVDIEALDGIEHFLEGVETLLDWNRDISGGGDHDAPCAAILRDVIHDGDT